MAPAMLEKLTGTRDAFKTRYLTNGVQVIQQYLSKQRDFTLGELMEECIASLVNEI